MSDSEVGAQGTGPRAETGTRIPQACPIPRACPWRGPGPARMKVDPA